MNYMQNGNNEFLCIKIAQTGDILKVALTQVNLKKQFLEIYDSYLKELKFKKQDTYISSEDGKMISSSDLKLSLEEIVNKFGLKLKLYYEKII